MRTGMHPAMGDRRLAAAILALGFTSIVTQTILLRESLSVFGGNELGIGILLANWMILTGCGAFIGRYAGHLYVRRGFLTSLLLLLVMLPPLCVVLLHLLRTVVAPLGGMLGIREILIISFIVLLPYCLVGGLLFTAFAQVLSSGMDGNPVARVYAMEAAGSIVGGLLFNLLLVHILTTFQALSVMLLADLAICAYCVSGPYQRVVPALLVCIGLAAVVLCIFIPVDLLLRRIQFHGQQVIRSVDSPYGNLTVTRQGDQRTWFEDGVMLFSTNDVVANEEAVHYAMLQHPRPRSVLLIAGGISGTIREITKYPVTRIDYAEINPALIEVGRQEGLLPHDARLHIFSEDARRFLRRSDTLYDVALVNVPDPATAQMNRYFTVDFLLELRKKLAPGGVVSLSLASSGEYLGAAALPLHSMLFRTMRACFPYLLIIPGNRNYYLASDNPLRSEPGEMARERGVRNVYVNGDYLDDHSIRERGNLLEASVDTSAALNTDFTPGAYHHQLRYWLSYERIGPYVPACFALLLLLLVVRGLDSITIGLFSGGFAASAIEILLLISFQVMLGYVYRATGLLITIFMAGLALGSSVRQPADRAGMVRRFIAVQCGIAFYALLLPSLLTMLKNAGSADLFLHACFAVLACTIGFCVGWEFNLAALLHRAPAGSAAGLLYAVDLAGSAVGALLISVYLLPLLGIGRVSFLVAAFTVLTALVAFVGRNRLLIVQENR